MLFAKTGCWRAVGEVMERDGWRAVKWWEMAASGGKVGCGYAEGANPLLVAVGDDGDDVFGVEERDVVGIEIGR